MQVDNGDIKIEVLKEKGNFKGKCEKEASIIIKLEFKTFSYYLLLASRVGTFQM